MRCKQTSFGPSDTPKWCAAAARPARIFGVVSAHLCDCVWQLLQHLLFSFLIKTKCARAICRACVSVRVCECVAFLLTAHFAFKGHLVIGAAQRQRQRLRSDCLRLRRRWDAAKLGCHDWPAFAACHSTHQWQQRQPVVGLLRAARDSCNLRQVRPTPAARQVHVWSHLTGVISAHTCAASMIFALLCSGPAQALKAIAKITTCSSNLDPARMIISFVYKLDSAWQNI